MAATADAQLDALRIGDLVIDGGSRQTWIGTTHIRLTKREFDLLFHLARHLGRVFSPEELLRNVWGYDYVMDSRLVSVHIGNLRKKLGSAPLQSVVVETVRGAGYRLVSNPMSSSEPGDGDKGTLFDPRSEWPCVGRARQLQSLLNAFDAASSGTGSFAIIEGEPGMGKTTTARLLADKAGVRGALVLWAHCHQSTTESQYWPWSQCLQTLTEVLPSDELSRHLKGIAPKLATLLPELASPFEELLMDETRLSDEPQVPLFHAVSELMLRVAADRPLVLVFDDLEYCDDKSLHVLELLADRIAQTPLLVIVTMGDSTNVCGAALCETLVTFDGAGCRRIPLSPLSPEETAELVGLTAGDKATTDAIRSVFRQSEGNPLFACEFARQLKSAEASHGRGAETPDQPPLTPKIRDAIRRRISQLTSEARALLGVAAVAGRVFSIALIRTVSGVDGDQLLSSLDEALKGRLIASGTQPGQLHFTHPLIRHVLLEDIGEIRRLDLHSKIARALEKRVDKMPSLLPAVAHHFVESAALRDANKAIEYCLQAGLEAMSRMAYEEAATHFHKAHDVLPIAELGQERRRALAITLREHTADALLQAGRADDAIPWYERALLLFPANAEAERVRLYTKITDAQSELPPQAMPDFECL